MNVLKYMASNGLVANPKKTALVFLNVKESKDPIKNKKGWKRLKKSSSTSFHVLQAPESWSKYTTVKFPEFEPKEQVKQLGRERVLPWYKEMGKDGIVRCT